MSNESKNKETLSLEAFKEPTQQFISFFIGIPRYLYCDLLSTGLQKKNPDKLALYICKECESENKERLGDTLLLYLTQY